MSGVTQVTFMNQRSFEDGYALYGWGYGTSGQLGSGTATNISSPTQVGSKVWELVNCSQYSASHAIKPDGSLWAWGSGSHGRLGLNDTISRSSPVQVGTLKNWKSVTGGRGFAIAIKTDGTLWSWGKNDNYAQLGVGDFTNRSSPVQIGALTTWDSSAAGDYQAYAIKTDNSLYGWGGNASGALGQNYVSPYYIANPVQISGSWSKVTSGTNSGLAIKTNGTLWGFGYNYEGHLGIGTGGNYAGVSSPVQVGGTTWASVSCKQSGTIARKTDGSIWTWGYNYYGDLGIGTDLSTAKSSPVQVGSLTTWSLVDAGTNSKFAIKTDGTLWSWGGNGGGALGQNDTTNRSSPVQVGSLTSWVSVSGGDAFAMGVAE